LKYYLDTSVIVDFVLGESTATAMVKSLEGQLFTSKLGRAETVRTMRKFYPHQLASADEFLRSIYLLAIADTVWEKVETFGPSITLATADSIHIATALLLIEGSGALVTLDKQMAVNAKKLGLQVISS
jgi:predicted nucleic acid-binding protein